MNFRRYFNILYIFFILCLIDICKSEHVKKSVTDNDEDTTEGVEDKNDSSDMSSEIVKCSRRSNSIVHEVKDALSGEFPFMAAIFSTQREYICSGAVVTNGLILTTTSCIDRSPAFVVLNTIRNHHTSNDSFILQIINTDKFLAQRNPSIGLLFTEKLNSSVTTKLKVSNINANREVIEFQAFGFGLNAEMGREKKLQYVGLEIRSMSPEDDPGLLNGFIDCIEIKEPVCFRDFGGPAIVNDELFGVVVKGESRCTKETSNEFAVNIFVASIVPVYTFKNWLDEQISKHEVTENSRRFLKFYPEKPIVKEEPKKPVPVPRASSAPFITYDATTLVASVLLFTFYYL